MMPPHSMTRSPPGPFTVSRKSGASPSQAVTWCSSRISAPDSRTPSIIRPMATSADSMCGVRLA